MRALNVTSGSGAESSSTDDNRLILDLYGNLASSSMANATLKCFMPKWRPEALRLLKSESDTHGAKIEDVLLEHFKIKSRFDAEFVFICITKISQLHSIQV